MPIASRNSEDLNILVMTQQSELNYGISTPILISFQLRDHPGRHIETALRVWRSHWMALEDTCEFTGNKRGSGYRNTRNLRVT